MLKQQIKDLFPWFKNNPDWLYLDTAGTTQKPQIVIDSITKYYQTQVSNPHSGNLFSNQSEDIIQDTRQTLAEFTGTTSKSIIFTKSSTEGFNLVAQAWGKYNLQTGDCILLSKAEHNSNLLPWIQLSKDLKFDLKYVGIDSSGQIDLKDLDYQLTTFKPKLVCLHHISNVLGVINDIRFISNLCKQHNAILLIDGTQGIAHERIDFDSLGADFYIFSGHKMYSSYGLGVVLINQKRIGEMHNWLLGGGAVDSVSFKDFKLLPSPQGWEPGSPDIASIKSLNTATKFLIKNLDRESERVLVNYLYDRLSEIASIQILGKKTPRASLVSFYHKQLSSFDLASLLASKKVIIRQGKHCADLLHQDLEIDGSLRVSLGVYNTKEDVDKFITKLQEVISSLS
jgi:selenocysteine lyase/cysteine desulfurase